MFKVIKAGGRNFNNYSLLKEKCNHYLKDKTCIEIVSGTAKIPDQLDEQYAKEKNPQSNNFLQAGSNS